LAICADSAGSGLLNEIVAMRELRGRSTDMPERRMPSADSR
jgi:hypothetical protein